MLLRQRLIVVTCISNGGGGGFDQGDDINEPLTCAEKERDNYNSDNWSQSLTVLEKISEG